MSKHTITKRVREIRPWQRECLAAIDMTAAAGGRDFLAAVTPSAGKTVLGLEYARRALAAGHIDIVAVLAPTIEIQNYWISEATTAGMTIAPSMAEGVDGVVFTYQGLAGAGAPLLEGAVRF